MDNPVSRQEFREETDKIYGKLNRHDRQIAVIETLVENLKGLPSAINSLNTNMALMGKNLEILNSKVDEIIDDKNGESKKDEEQDKLIKELDEKSKIDILDFIRDNWFKICVGCALVGILLKDLVNIG